MCSSPKAPKLPPPPKPTEELKMVTADAAAARDNTQRRLATRLSFANARQTGPLGLVSSAQTTSATLLGG